jgi:hypothetical protein
MNAEQKKLLRDALLAALVTMAPLSLPLATLRNAARAAGFRLEEEELARELDYLVGKGLVIEKAEELSAGATRWKATSAAVDYCEKEGLT